MSYFRNYTSVDPKYELSGFNVEISSNYHEAKDTPSLSTGNQLSTQLKHRQPIIHLAQAQATSYANQLFYTVRRFARRPR